ncbi:MAG: hypothetical protein APF76_08375 [Desulfitibacter sp. BRH_c19]|nr:MAG: hypothetical protein APF76_08375 [Desulfitibacter sp. BRH_c19]
MMVKSSTRVLFWLGTFYIKNQGGKSNVLIKECSKCVVTKEMEQVATQEKVSPEFIRQGVAEGRIVILKNERGDFISPLLRVLL